MRRRLLLLLASTSLVACAEESVGSKLRVDRVTNVSAPGELSAARYINHSSEVWRLVSSCAPYVEESSAGEWVPATTGLCEGPAESDATLAPGDTLILIHPLPADGSGGVAVLRFRADFYQGAGTRFEIRYSEPFLVFTAP